MPKAKLKKTISFTFITPAGVGKKKEYTTGREFPTKEAASEYAGDFFQHDDYMIAEIEKDLNGKRIVALFDSVDLKKQKSAEADIAVLHKALNW